MTSFCTRSRIVCKKGFPLVIKGNAFLCELFSQGQGTTSSILKKSPGCILLSRGYSYDLHRNPEQDRRPLSKLDRKVLVWVGKYKSDAEIPDYVSISTVKRANDRMRVRVAIWMVIVTLAGAYVAVLIGRRDAASGESLSRTMMEQHRELRRQGLAAEQNSDNNTK